MGRQLLFGFIQAGGGSTELLHMKMVICSDSKKCAYSVKLSILITHLNETNQKMLFQSGDADIKVLIENDMIPRVFKQIHLSSTRFSEDISKYRI